MKIVLSTEAIHPPLAGIGRYTWELATRLPKHEAVQSIRYMRDGGWCELQDPEVKPAPPVQVTSPTQTQQVDESSSTEKSQSATVPPLAAIAVPVEPVLNFKGRIRKRIETIVLTIYRALLQIPNMFRRIKQSLRHRLGQLSILSRLYARLMPVRATNHLNAVQGAIYHGPNFFVPETHLPTVVTIHDLSIFRFPQWHPKARIDRMKQAIPESIKRASLILTISEATRNEVLQMFKVDPEKVHTVLLGVDAIYHPRTEAELRPVLAQFGLEVGKYTFFVSTIEPRKNLRNLIAAYRQLPEDLRMQCPLVLVGGPGWQSEDIHADIERASAEGWLKYLGFAEQKNLPYFYAGCRLFAYPSWYEGFGLPIAEAMASGVPVVTSNNSSMPEVAAGAALLVDPADVGNISDCLLKGLQDDVWRAEAIERGLKRAAELSWDACINNTVAAYQRIKIH